MGFLDLEKHYSFYGSYHNDSRNKLIHIIFVWPIFFSALLLLNYSPPLFSSPFSTPFSNWGFPGHQYIVLNTPFFVALFYSFLYFSMDPKSGGVASCLIFFCLFCAQALFQILGGDVAWKVGAAIQLVSWISQFVGHGIFEKRSPALVDNLFQALLMAPFFVLLEVLESVFGYEPYSGFHHRVRENVSENIRQFRAKKKM